MKRRLAGVGEWTTLGLDVRFYAVGREMNWLLGLKFLLKRSAEVIPRDSREGRPGPGITSTTVDAASPGVGMAVTEERSVERRRLRENFMVTM